MWPFYSNGKQGGVARVAFFPSFFIGAGIGGSGQASGCDRAIYVHVAGLTGCGASFQGWWSTCPATSGRQPV